MAALALAGGGVEHVTAEPLSVVAWHALCTAAAPSAAGGGDSWRVSYQRRSSHSSETKGSQASGSSKALHAIARQRCRGGRESTKLLPFDTKYVAHQTSSEHLSTMQRPVSHAAIQSTRCCQLPPERIHAMCNTSPHPYRRMPMPVNRLPTNTPVKRHTTY